MLKNKFMFVVLFVVTAFSEDFYNLNASEYESSFLNASDKTLKFKAGEVGLLSIDMKMKKGYTLILIYQMKYNQIFQEIL